VENYLSTLFRVEKSETVTRTGVGLAEGINTGCAGRHYSREHVRCSQGLGILESRTQLTKRKRLA